MVMNVTPTKIPETGEVPIKILPLDGPTKSKDILSTPDKLGFGQNFTDRMFSMEYINKKWHDATIKKNEPLTLDPACLVFHYGQEIFEGMKGFRQENGRIVLFRPESNIQRMNQYAERMCMPKIDSKLFWKD
jgi:branched-chain amino acid aminotransferase